jgi:hypothetical protein
MEDIPPGVSAVLTESTTDVLSHVAIRARSQGVLLATCFDEGEWARLTAMQVCANAVREGRYASRWGGGVCRHSIFGVCTSATVVPALQSACLSKT